MLGAGQAGIVVGRRDLVARVKKNPLMRAVRPDKMTLAALEATLRAYLDGASAWDEVPVLRMLNAPLGDLRARADALLARVYRDLQARGVPVAEEGECAGDPGYGIGGPWSGGEDAPLPALRAGGAALRVGWTLSCVGGGALPTEELPSYALCLAVDGTSPNALRDRLVARRPRPVVARVDEGELVCDVRTLVDARDEDDVAAALADLVAEAAGNGPVPAEGGRR